MRVKNSWVTLILLVAMLFVDVVLFVAFFVQIGFSYERAKLGELDYYYYIAGNSLFVFITAFFLTLTGIVFVIHEGLVKGPKAKNKELIEMSDLNAQPQSFLSIDFIADKATEDKPADQALSATADTQVSHANFILHDTCNPTGDQLESFPVLRLTGESSRLKNTRFTVKNSPDIDTFYKPFVAKQFVPLSVLSCVGMYISATLFLLGISAFGWAIVVAQYYRYLSFKAGWSFTFVEFASGILAPFLVLSSITVSSFVLSYFTRQNLSIRTGITALLESVRLCQHRDGSEYWLIGTRFKYELPHGVRRRRLIKRHPWVETHYSTWALWLVICIALLFAFSLFVNQTVITERTSYTCLTDYDCFLGVEPFNYEHIVCIDSDNDTFDITYMRNQSVASLPNNTILYCFRYLDFGVENNLFLAVGISYSLYLFVIAFFHRIFNAFAILIQIKQTRLWGVILILIGVLGVISMVVIFFLNSFIVGIISYFEILQFSIYLFVIGVLILVYCHEGEHTTESRKSD